MAGLGQCCATGSLHTGTPTGRVEKVHGLDCYVAEAPSGQPKGIVVIIPDAFGWTLPNNRILADCYAKNGGFTVYLPEFMSGAGIPEEALLSLKAFSATGLTAQLAKIYHALMLVRWMAPFFWYCRDSVSKPKIAFFLSALKTKSHPDLPIGTAGFCWGGKWVTELCWDAEMNRGKDGQRLTKCGFTAHPSRLAFPGDIEKVRLPYSVAAAEVDFMMSKNNAKQTEDILTAKTKSKDVEGVEHEFVMYPGVHHGFAVRADEGEKAEADAGKKAERQAIDFFTRWFAS